MRRIPVAWFAAADGADIAVFAVHGFPVRGRLALCVLGAAAIGLLRLFDRRDQAAAAEESD